MKGTSFIDPRLPADVPPVNPDFVHTSLLRVRNRSGGQEHSPTRSEAVSQAYSVPNASLLWKFIVTSLFKTIE